MNYYVGHCFVGDKANIERARKKRRGEKKSGGDKNKTKKGG